MRTQGLGAAGLALLLSACSDTSYDSDRYFCAGFVPSSQVTSTIGTGCTSCSVNNLPAVIDGNVESFADIALNTAASGQGVTVRATATSGSPFPIGSNAGAVLGISSAARSQLTVNITTYLAGSLQETNAMTTASGVMATDDVHPDAYYGFTTAKTFDAVEFQVVNGTSTTAQDVHLHGLCSNGGPIY